ncbi:MAG: polysaccharide biosynthesis C-terminal domain-containing protein [Cyclobacteriaceae bacterium]|nr:polysaccharide biosynthesis C-terminal domain-containing protein [Cyclobacteriaceae bacterium]
MGHLKKLAGQTIIYGVSSILGRIINYFLVPLHTTLFLKNELGVVSYFYGYTALALILITFGMETTFFRFATKDDNPKTYHVAATSVIFISLLFSIFISIGTPYLSVFLTSKFNIAINARMIYWLAAIVFIDGATAIPFARLRLENRPIKFAAAKTIAILGNIGLQLLFLVLFPAIHNQEFLVGLKPMVDSIYNPNLGIEYIFLANLISNSVWFILLAKEFLQIKLSLNWNVLKPMLFYALPILITGFAGWVTNELDKVAVAEWSKGGVFAQGVYSQTFKLGALMMLAIQAFRYAVEPFFFSQAKDKQAPALFAKTMHFYFIMALLIMLAVCLNIDLIADLLLRRPEYRVALFLVPIIMFGKLLFGVYINISIWFKLKDQTSYGILYTLIGAIITFTGNYFFLGRFGYISSAVTIVVAYFVMSLVSYRMGKKRYPVPYNFKPLIVYTIIVLTLIYFGYHITLSNMWLDCALNIIVTLAFIAITYSIERKRIFQPIE